MKRIDWNMVWNRFESDRYDYVETQVLDNVWTSDWYELLAMIPAKVLSSVQTQVRDRVNSVTRPVIERVDHETD